MLSKDIITPKNCWRDHDLSHPAQLRPRRRRALALASASLPGQRPGNAWGVWTYKRRGQDKQLIAELQVKQTLKKN